MAYLMKASVSSPTTYAEGKFWLNNNTGQVYCYTGGVWRPFIDGTPFTFPLGITVYIDGQDFTERINKMMDIAIDASDHATKSFLQWFVDEQVEEEANVTEILDTLKLIDGQGNGIFMLDREMKQRVFVNTTNTAG